MSPKHWSKDCGIARRCKLFLGAELERGLMGTGLPVRLAATERRGEFAAASLQTQSYLEREHNARWAVLGVAHATSGITANVLTLLLPRNILARNQLKPYLQAARGKEVEQWQSGADHNVIAN